MTRPSIEKPLETLAYLRERSGWLDAHRDFSAEEEGYDLVSAALVALWESEAALRAENARLVAERDGLMQWHDQHEEREAASCPEDVGCIEFIGYLKDSLAAERARAEAMAARVEMMKQVSDEMLYQFSEPTFPGTECRQSGHVRLSTITAWRAFLNSTPASAADLEAHDAKVREPLEREIGRLEGRVSAQDERIASMQREAIRSAPLAERAFVLKTQAELFALQAGMDAHDAQVLREAVERVRDFFGNTNGPEDWCFEDLYAVILNAAHSEVQGTAGVEAIMVERKRQIEVEGWTQEHDDRHDSGELSAAAAAYLLTPDAPRLEGEP